MRAQASPPPADQKVVIERHPSGWFEQFVGKLLLPETAATMQWRSLGWKWVAAGGLVLGTLAAGVGENFNERVIAALGAAGLVLGILLLVLAPRLNPRFLLPVMVVGTMATSIGIVFCHTSHTPYILLYAWISAEAWYLLDRRAAMFLTGLAVIASGPTIAVAGAGDGDALSWWLMVVGTLVVVSGLAALLRRRSDDLIERLERAATHDELTGLLNRRGYQQRLDAELARAEREGTPVSLILGDIDSFKSLNDRFGHRCGDEALARFAAVCRGQRRGADFVARVGGEEFAMVLPGTDSAGALLAAERLREAIHSGLCRPDGAPLTASFGVATFPDQASDCDALLGCADRAMYAAKAGGRDRTMTCGALRADKAARPDWTMAPASGAVDPESEPQVPEVGTGSLAVAGSPATSSEPSIGAGPT